MKKYLLSIIQRACIYIYYLDYIYNVNNDINVLKNILCLFIDNINPTQTFKTNVFKLTLLRYSYHYKYIYSSYSNYLNDFIRIFNINENITFLSEFKIKINSCENIFVLFLFYLVFKEKYKREFK